ncbi:MAG TPA: hypothetical protein VFO11_13715 [Candidatus Polarisedimenticolaceae bacterium]|nr:hypothetical protein [Candidatus Polarisedimenticolaceae bacterium]
MSRRADEELILLYYREHPAPEELEREMASDPALARRYETLRRELFTLDTLDAPEPRPGLEQRMWARVRPSLERPRRFFGLPGWVALAGAVAVLVVAAFLAGRAQRAPDETTVASDFKALPADARERVLQAALADHLESSQRLILEVVNGPETLGGERAWAEALLSQNRLYRRAAERAGQRRVAAVLQELEPVLTELANAPDSLDLSGARAQIEESDLLFKMRITRNNLKEQS